MRSIIKVLIVVLIMNACYQAIQSYWTFLKYKEEVHERVLNGIYSSSTEMHQALIDMGRTYGLELDWDNVQLSKEEDTLVVDLNYVDNVQFVPRFYSRPWAYEAKLYVRRLRPLKLDELAR